LACVIENVGSNGCILQRLGNLENLIIGLKLLLSGDSKFDREIWRKLAEKINNSETEHGLHSHKELVPKELEVAKNLIGKKLAFSKLFQISRFFPSDRVKAFVSMTQYGIIRFYFVFTILYCMNTKMASISNEQQRYLHNRLLDYFGLNSFELSSLQLSNFWGPEKDCVFDLTENIKFDSYVDVCIETVADYMDDCLCLDRDFIENQRKKLISSIYCYNGGNKMAEENAGLFQVFENKLSNLLNANAICLTNNIPIASVGDAGTIFAFSTNKFLESYRRELLALFNNMSHIDQARLRKMIGSNSFLKLLNRFPL